MNKMKVGYQIPVRRIYRLTETDKSNKNDVNSARSGQSANNVITKECRGSKFSVVEGTSQDKENQIMESPRTDQIPTRKPLAKRQT